MDIVSIFALVILILSIFTLLVGVAAYLAFKIRQSRGKAVKVGGCSVLVVASVADGAVGAGVAAVFGAFGATAEVVSAAWPARMIDAAVSTCGASIVRTGATAVWTAAAGTMAACGCGCGWGEVGVADATLSAAVGVCAGEALALPEVAPEAVDSEGVAGRVVAEKAVTAVAL